MRVPEQMLIVISNIYREGGTRFSGRLVKTPLPVALGRSNKSNKSRRAEIRITSAVVICTVSMTHSQQYYTNTY